MKKLYTTLVFSILLASAYAQVPQKLSWQGIVRNADGTPITTPVELRFSILQGVNAVFTEQTPITPNQFGLVVWNIGEVETSSFAAIDWASGGKTLKVEMRTTVGTGNFSDVGTEEFKSVPYAQVAGKAIIDNDSQNLTLSGSTLSISGGNTVTLPADGDGSSTNEIQTITLSGQTLILSNGGGSVSLPPNTDAQMLTLTGQSLTISGGNTVTLPTDGDGSSTNEIQTLTLTGETLSLSNGGGSVTLQSGSVPQTLSVDGQNLTISGGNTVTLPPDGDNSATNEIQTVSLSGQTLTLSNGGGSVTLPTGTTYTAGSGIAINGNIISNSGDGDSNPANEIQVLALSGQTLSLSNGGGSISLPPETQTLAVNGQNLTISGGNTISLPFDGDSSDINEIQKISLVNDSLRLSKNGGLVILKDTSSTNEIQTLTLSGVSLSLSNGGGSVTLPTGTTYTAGNGIAINGNVISNSGDNDNSPNNEIQQVSLSGQTLSLSNGGGSVNLPSYQAGAGITIAGNTISAQDDSPGNELQAISLDGDQLSLSLGGGTVTLPTNPTYWDENGANIYNNNFGNVGVGTNTPTYKLDVAGPINLNNGQTGIAMYANGSEAMWYNGSWYSWGTGGGNNYFNSVVSIGTNVCCWWLEVAGDAAKPGGGAWSALSDKRYKKDVQPYTDGLSSILKINPVRYHYNEKSGYDTNPEYVGVIAQELQKTAPYMIKEMPTGQLNGTQNETTANPNDTPMNDGSDDTYLSVDNSAMTYMLINAIKEQQAQIEQLKAQVQLLQQQFEQNTRKRKK